MQKNTKLLILIGVIFMAGGWVLYHQELYVLHALNIDRYGQIKGATNQNALIVEKFPTDLKADPVTGEKIFDGLGVRFRIPSIGFHIMLSTSTQSIYIITNTDNEEIHKIQAIIDASPGKYIKGEWPSGVSIEFSLNKKHLTLVQYIDQEVSKILKLEPTKINEVVAIKVKDANFMDETREIFFVTPNGKYIVSISSAELGFDDNAKNYLAVFKRVLSSFEFTR